MRWDDSDRLQRIRQTDVGEGHGDLQKKSTCTEEEDGGSATGDLLMPKSESFREERTEEKRWREFDLFPFSSSTLLIRGNLWGRWSLSELEYWPSKARVVVSAGCYSTSYPHSESGELWWENANSADFAHEWFYGIRTREWHATNQSGMVWGWWVFDIVILVELPTFRVLSIEDQLLLDSMMWFGSCVSSCQVTMLGARHVIRKWSYHHVGKIRADTCLSLFNSKNSYWKVVRCPDFEVKCRGKLSWHHDD